jgi:hypothetical protein
MTSTATFEKRTWQDRPITQVIAVAVVCIPPYALVIWSQLSQRTITRKKLFLYPLFLGGCRRNGRILRHRKKRPFNKRPTSSWSLLCRRAQHVQPSQGSYKLA